MPFSLWITPLFFIVRETPVKRAQKTLDKFIILLSIIDFWGREA